MYINKKTFAQVCCMLCLVLISFPSVSQDLQKRMSRTVPRPRVKANIVPQFAPRALVSNNGNPATISAFSPMSAGKGLIVTITGNNLGGVTVVKFGGKPAESFEVVSQTQINAKPGDGNSGNVEVSKDGTTFQSLPGFVFIPAPKLTSVTPADFEKGDEITINGENFIGTVVVIIDDTAAADVTVVSTTTITATVMGSVSAKVIQVTTDGGEATITPNSTVNVADGAAEVTLPNIASGGFNIIPTPSFIFTQIYKNRRTGFSATMWGNALGTDSSMAFVKNKLLNPRLSIFGLQAEWNYQLNPPDKLMAVNFVAQANFLLKKIAYFDTSSKINTNITPFVVQPKLGISTAFFKNKVFFGAYYNILYVTTENDAFGKFFATEKKSLFSFPEINFGGYFDISDTKSIKVELDFIGNTSDTKRIYDNADKGIWFLKLGFKSAL